MFTRDHTVLPATHTFIKWNEPYLSLLPSYSVTALWSVHIFYLTEVTRLSRPEWDGHKPRWFTRLQMVTHSSTKGAWHRVTSLIETNTLPLSYAATHNGTLINSSLTMTINQDKLRWHRATVLTIAVGGMSAVCLASLSTFTEDRFLWLLQLSGNAWSKLICGGKLLNSVCAMKTPTLPHPSVPHPLMTPTEYLTSYQAPHTCAMQTLHDRCMCVCMYPSGRGPAYSGPIRWGLYIAGPLR